jgi:tetratricopeptide (TPR) repeat protein
MTDKISETMQVAERAYSLAREQDDSALMIGAYRALAATFYFLGDFESTLQYAMRGVQLWRSGSIQSSAQELYTPAVGCLSYAAVSEWHLGDIASSQADMAEAISLAKELNDLNGLALALQFAAYLAHYERNPIEVERSASELIELSTSHNFEYWLSIGSICRGWARSVAGDTAEGIPWIERGIRDYRANGLTLVMPYLLALKAEALHLADRTPEALRAVEEAEALVERIENRFWCAELHRLRGEFLTAIGANEAPIEISFCAAIRIAKEQKSVSLEKRAEATYAEYRRQKASGSGGREFRLPLW